MIPGVATRKRLKGSKKNKVDLPIQFDLQDLFQISKRIEAYQNFVAFDLFNLMPRWIFLIFFDLPQSRIKIKKIGTRSNKSQADRTRSKLTKFLASIRFDLRKKSNRIGGSTSIFFDL